MTMRAIDDGERDADEGVEGTVAGPPCIIAGFGELLVSLEGVVYAVDGVIEDCEAPDGFTGEGSWDEN